MVVIAPTTHSVGVHLLSRVRAFGGEVGPAVVVVAGLAHAFGVLLPVGVLAV